MRLTSHEIAAIKACAAEAFGDEAVVRLFGSRVDDSRRGGDIDLHVETAVERATFRNEIRFLAALERDIGERRVDIRVLAHGAAPDLIDRVAMETGVVL